MCGRYNITDSPLTQALLEELGIDSGPLPTRYNIAPTEYVPVIFDSNGERLRREMRWWLVPSWSDGPSQKYAMFNARSENLKSSSAYRGPFKHRRCIIPASSFIEWQKVGDVKQPQVIEGVDSALAFAGVWDYWEEGEESIYSCSIVTTQAAPSFEHIHSRMPVMLASEHYDWWLDPTADHREMESLFAPALNLSLKITAANRNINNATNKFAPELEDDSEIIH